MKEHIMKGTLVRWLKLRLSKAFIVLQGIIVTFRMTWHSSQGSQFWPSLNGELRSLRLNHTRPDCHFLQKNIPLLEYIRRCHRGFTVAFRTKG